MRILLVTDAWAPQVNGVVVTLDEHGALAASAGDTRCEVISPEGFRTFPMPTYPEIPLAILPGAQGRRGGSANSIRMRSTSRPRDRSARRRAPTA